MKTKASAKGQPALCTRLWKFLDAFTRIELVLSLAGVFLLGLVVLPLAANTKPRSEQIACWNNLRQVGHGVQSWASDHANTNPWWVSIYSGGTRSSPKPGNAWMEFYWMRNELGSPKILACPSDTKRAALDWKEFGTIQNGALSYFVGIHSYFDEPFSILSGDRNLKTSATNVACTAGFNNASTLTRDAQANQWTDKGHSQTGNLLLNGGAVRQLSNLGLYNTLSLQATSWNGVVVHILLPN